MTPQELLARVDEKSCLDFLSAMVRHRSHTQTPGERKLVEFMVEKMRSIGLEAEPSPVETERFNAIGRWRGAGGGHSLLFNGHVDTNPVTEGWTVDPYGGKVDDKFIWGIGVSNMKAGDAASYCAVKTLREAGVKLKGDVILTYVVGELQGGVGTLAFIKSGLRADYFVNSEPTDVQAMTMHAGAFMFIVELIGDTRHLSKREEAVDAALAACDLVPRLDAMIFSGAPDAEHRSINRCHVGVVHAALGRNLEEWRPPQVADYAVLKGSCRYAPGQTEEQVLADMERELAGLRQRFPGLKTVLNPEHKTGRPAMPTFEVSRTSPIVTAINRAYQEVRGVEQPTGAIRPPAYYGTDAAHLCRAAGMEGVVCGPGGRYNTMPDERVDIPDFLDMVRIYMLTILEICGVAE